MTSRRVPLFFFFFVVLFFLPSFSPAQADDKLVVSWLDLQEKGYDAQSLADFRKTVEELKGSDEYSLTLMNEMGLYALINNLLVLSSGTEDASLETARKIDRNMERYMILTGKLYEHSLNIIVFVLFLLMFFVIAFIVFILLYRIKSRRIANIQSAIKIERAVNSATIRMQEEERSRIYRDLHDTIAQDSRAALFSLHDLHKYIEPGIESEQLYHAIESYETANIENVRNIIRNIVPPELMNDVRRVFREWCAQFSTMNKMDCQIVIRDEAPLEALSQSFRLNLFRIMQESVVNSQRHSGGNEVNILIRDGQMSDGRPSLTMIVSDDGVGFDSLSVDFTKVEGNHYGLHGIYERVFMMGGTMRLHAVPDGGVQVHVDIPVDIDKYR